MDKKIKLEILRYWMNDFSKIPQVPKQLEGIVSKEEVTNLYLELPQSPDSIGGTSSTKPHDIAKYIDQIEASLRQEAKLTSSEKELKLQEQIKNIYEKQVKIQEQQTAILEQTKENSKEQTKIQKAMFWIYVSIAFFSLALIFATLVPSCQSNRILNKQTEIQQQQVNISRIQTEILRKANPSFEPFIEVVPDFDDLIIPAWETVNKRDFDSEPSKRWARADLTFYNFGKMDSQHIYCYPNIKDRDFGAYITPDSNIHNLPAGTSNRSVLHIKYWDCQQNELEYCRPELVPIGVHNLTFECTCLGCKTQSKFEVPIQYCVYYRNKSTECPDGILNKNLSQI